MRAGRRSSIAAIATAAVLALTLGACGGSSSPKSAPAGTTPTKASGNVLLSSVQTTAATKSAHVAMSVSSSGVMGFSLTAEGDEDLTSGNADLTMKYGGAMSSFLEGDLEIRVVDHVVYMKLPDSIAGFLGGAEGKWLSIDGSGAAADNSFAGLGEGTDPTKFLAYLEKASDDVKTVGTETVNGVETTHYHATIDLGKSIDDAKVPPALRAHVKELWQKSGADAPTLPVDVWVDGEGRVVRMKMDMDLAAFSGKAAGASGAAALAPSISVTIDLSKFGEPVNVTAPPADQVVDVKSILKNFGVNGGGLFGGAGGLGGANGGGFGLPSGAPATKGA